MHMNEVSAADDKTALVREKLQLFAGRMRLGAGG